MCWQLEMAGQHNTKHTHDDDNIVARDILKYIYLILSILSKSKQALIY